MDIRIYVLIDPFTNEYRYVGKTVETLRARLKGHLSQSKRTQTPGHKEHWIRALIAKGVKPIVKEIEICNEHNWQDREKHWIAFGKEQGWPLTNLSPGGDGWHGPRHNDKFKQDLRNRMIGNKQSLGVKWTDEQRELRRKTPSWNKGKRGAQKFSEESKRRRSERMRGDKHHGAKLTDMQIIEMRRRFNSGDAAKDIAIDYKINYSHCIKIVTNKTRTSCVPS